MTPHAPTTAELRLFRQRTGVQHDGGYRCATFWHPKGAHDYERRDGIGWMSAGIWRPLPVASRAFYANARREASAMRSRAFEAMAQDYATDGLALMDAERWPDDLRAFVPEYVCLNCGKPYSDPEGCE